MTLRLLSVNIYTSSMAESQRHGTHTAPVEYLHIVGGRSVVSW